MAEWLRRLPAKQFPFGSVGSNPAVVVFYCRHYYNSVVIYIILCIVFMVNKKKMEVRGIDPRAPRMQSECSTI